MTIELGADRLVFEGDRTRITYSTQLPVPTRQRELRYEGPEGDITYTDDEITQLDSPLGTLLSVPLRANDDAGAISVTVLVPAVSGVTPQAPVTFATIAIRTTGRGFIAAPGVALTYDVLPLLGTASQVLLPSPPTS